MRGERPMSLMLRRWGRRIGFRLRVSFRHCTSSAPIRPRRGQAYQLPWPRLHEDEGEVPRQERVDTDGTFNWFRVIDSKNPFCAIVAAPKRPHRPGAGTSSDSLPLPRLTPPARGKRPILAVQARAARSSERSTIS